VQGCRRKLSAKSIVSQNERGKSLTYFRNGGKLPQKPRNELKLGEICLAWNRSLINGIFGEIQPCDAKTFFIDSIIIEGIIVHYACHSDEGKMIVHGRHMPEGKGIAAGGDDDLLPVGKQIV